MDALAPTLSRPVFAQIGTGGYQPLHMDWKASVPAREFDTLLQSADAIVSHAGTGTILLAQKLHKPVVIMARRAAQGEHRNDHQVATAAQMVGRSGIYVADDETGLAEALHRALTVPYVPDSPGDRTRIKDAIRHFLAG
nr:glycosyltransferase [Sphingobium subterraneum]